MPKAGSIDIVLNANAKGFDSGISKAQKGIAGLVKGFADIYGAIGTAKAAFDAVVGVAHEFANEINRLDKIGDLATRFDITAEAVQRLQRTIQLSGGEVESLHTILSRFAVNIGDASGGRGSAVGALKQLNLRAQDFTKIPLDQSFERIARRIATIKDATQRASIATDIFGKSATEIMEVFTRANVFEDAASDVERFGVKLDELSQDNVSKASESLERLSMAWSSLKAEMALTVAPAAATAAEGTAGVLAGIRDPSQRARFVDSIIPPNQSGNNVPWWQRHGMTSDPGRQPPRFAPKFLPPSVEPQSDSLDAYLMRSRFSFPQGPAARLPGFSQFGDGGVAGWRFRDALGLNASTPRSLGIGGGGAGAFEFGSAAAHSAIQQSQREDEMRKLQREEVQESKKQTKALEEMRGFFKNTVQLVEAGLQG